MLQILPKEPRLTDGRLPNKAISDPEGLLGPIGSDWVLSNLTHSWL